jgi:hypothetical protein
MVPMSVSEAMQANAQYGEGKARQSEGIEFMRTGLDGKS